MSPPSLRILQVIRSLDLTCGGPAESIRRQVEMRAQWGITTTIATFDPPSASSVIPGARVVCLGRGIGVYGYLPGAVARLKALATDHDVAVINGLWQYHALAAHRAFAGDLPYAVFPHGMLDPWFNRTYPLKALKKRLYWNWGDFRVLRDAGAVCFTSSTEQLLARESFNPYVAREMVVGYGTAAPPVFSANLHTAFQTQCPGIGKRPYLLFLSRIHAKKGCDLLVSAFASIAERWPELVLVMAGPDQDGLADRLHAQAATAGVADRILWPGMLQGDAKWGAFYGAEAFCLPSHQENFGIAVVEALACGVPVLISDQINIWKEILDDRAGLVDNDTVEGASRLLNHWLDSSATERSIMRQAARTCFASRFEIRSAALSLVKLLERVRVGDLPIQWRRK